MKLLLFASCIVLFGCSAMANPLQQIQEEINQLKIKDEALENDYKEKIKSLVNNYEDKITNYDEKIASLEQQLVRDIGLQSGKLIYCQFRFFYNLTNFLNGGEYVSLPPSNKVVGKKCFHRCLVCSQRGLPSHNAIGRQTPSEGRFPLRRQTPYSEGLIDTIYFLHFQWKSQWLSQLV